MVFGNEYMTTVLVWIVETFIMRTVHSFVIYNSNQSMCYSGIGFGIGNGNIIMF